MNPKKTKLKCTHCKQVIEGDLRGTFSPCKCGKIAVDQTEHYTRIIGNDGDYKILK
ncbi:MAG: hypothetical protein J4203_08180 [Candidatus Diapherotrites archaeon]|uniref:DUF7695 domain-containing protein n=1 Tax=Candidatus Iainarchaeum sp. TaxID=3101447 RepID=A0A8T4LH13_9ARCH|nr:hypothetical protein [Candidatus Diapherotrites archaeon]